jgi:hypothetical protein
MFKRTVPKKQTAPLFASQVYPDGKVKKVDTTVTKSLNTYEVIREKVINDMEPKVSKPEPKQHVKKKLFTG